VLVAALADKVAGVKAASKCAKLALQTAARGVYQWHTITLHLPL